MLTIRFPVGPGEALVYSRALCFRFCADGTLRGGDNSIAARRAAAGWKIGQGLYRELECAGPVVVMARRTRDKKAERYGPFDLLRATAGMLIADEASLDICLPAWEGIASIGWHEVVLLPASPTI